MVGGTQGRAARHAAVLVAVVGIVHRAALFLVYRDDLDALIGANATWYTGQNAPLALLWWVTSAPARCRSVLA